MDPKIEALNDDFAKSYQETFANDTSLSQIIDQVLELLQPNSQVLDVGCGTGKPVSFRLAAANHTVTGVDLSQKMLDRAISQVPAATFYKSDMLKYDPGTDKFHAIFAIFSLFHLSRAQTQHMVSKFASWLHPGGRLILATTPSTSIFYDQSDYDESGEWVDQKPMFFMGHEFDGTATTPAAWRRLFEQEGFTVESELSHLYEGAAEVVHGKEPRHYYFIARKSS